MTLMDSNVIEGVRQCVLHCPTKDVLLDKTLALCLVNEHAILRANVAQLDHDRMAMIQQLTMATTLAWAQTMIREGIAGMWPNATPAELAQVIDEALTGAINNIELPAGRA